MGKADRKGRTKTSPRFVLNYEWMLKSPAYRSLSCYSRCLLEEIKRLYNGTNNGELYLSVRGAAELLNAHKDTAAKAFGELENKGFIRARTKGSFSQKIRHATTWILTEYEYAGQLPTKAFMSWCAPDEKQNTGRLKRTDGPTKPDNRRLDRTEKELDGPSKPDRDPTIDPTPGPTRPHTYNLPGGGGLDEAPDTHSNLPENDLGTKLADGEVWIKSERHLLTGLRDGGACAEGAANIEGVGMMRAELTALERDEQVAEWIELSAKIISGQSDPKIGRGRP